MGELPQLFPGEPLVIPNGMADSAPRDRETPSIKHKDTPAPTGSGRLQHAFSKLAIYV